MKEVIALNCESASLIGILNKLYIILCVKVANVIKLLITYFCIPKNFDFCLSQFFKCRR